MKKKNLLTGVLIAIGVMYVIATIIEIVRWLDL